MHLLLDADVLIDYRDSDLDVLRLVVKYMAPGAVLEPVLEQVHGLSASACRELGLEVVLPETAELLAANELASHRGAATRTLCAS